MVFSKLASLAASAEPLRITVPPFSELTPEARDFTNSYESCNQDSLVSFFENKLSEITAMEEDLCNMFSDYSNMDREVMQTRLEKVQLQADIEKSQKKQELLQAKCREIQKSNKELEQDYIQKLKIAQEKTASLFNQDGDTGNSQKILVETIESMEKKLCEDEQDNIDKRKRLEEIETMMINKQKHMESFAQQKVLQKQMGDAIRAQKKHMLEAQEMQIQCMEQEVLEHSKKLTDEKTAIAKKNAELISHRQTITETGAMLEKAKEKNAAREKILEVLAEKNSLLRSLVKSKDVAFIQLSTSTRDALQQELRAVEAENENKAKACRDLQQQIRTKSLTP